MKSTIKILIVLCLLNINAIHAQEKGSFKDARDDKTYKTIQIGDQIWMAENLKFWSDKNSPGYIGVSHYYKGVNANYQRYGRLYSWEVANKACPEGWHLPSLDEWITLINSFGDLYNSEGRIPTKRESSKEKVKERRKLIKDIDAMLIEGGTSGFHVLYGGYRDPNPPNSTSYNPNKTFVGNLADNMANHPGHFFGIGKFGTYWSSDDDVKKGMFKKIKANAFQFQKQKWPLPFYTIQPFKRIGCSVRCVKNK